MENKERTAEQTGGVSTASGRKFVTVGRRTHGGKDKPTISYLTAFMHLVKGYIGTGVLALGHGFKDSGIILGPILLFILALMNLYCQHLLIRATVKISDVEEEEVKPSFAEVVQYTAEDSEFEWIRKHSGKFGVIANVFIGCTELGFCCVYFVFIASHLLEIVVDYDLLDKDNSKNIYIMLAIILVPMWLSTYLGNLRLLFPLTLLANAAMWTAMLMLIYYMSRDEYTNVKDLNLAGLRYLPEFFGTALFAFEGITFIIPLRNEMKHPKNFTSPLGVLNMAMIFVFILFLIVGFVSYWKYGEAIEGSVFLNLPGKETLQSESKNLNECLRRIVDYIIKS